MDDLGDACDVWQSGRDGGSSPLRAAARVVTRVPHYFSASYIDQYDNSARQNPDALARARVLLAAIANSEMRDASHWRDLTGLPGPLYASRGLAERQRPGKPKGEDEDGQIERLVTASNAMITMPLWGFSLSEEMALSFGTRFVFRVHEPFHAIAAWQHSGVKPEEQELIGSGHYRVLDTSWDGDMLIVDLQEQSLIMLPEPTRL
jgi:hypothetical protein